MLPSTRKTRTRSPPGWGRYDLRPLFEKRLLQQWKAQNAYASLSLPSSLHSLSSSSSYHYSNHVRRTKHRKANIIDIPAELMPAVREALETQSTSHIHNDLSKSKRLLRSLAKLINQECGNTGVNMRYIDLDKIYEATDGGLSVFQHYFLMSISTIPKLSFQSVIMMKPLQPG
ncbi:MAG: hypothetical protein IPH20_18520 [Bacteroidales bacterium]|nr:hypothetical protein [Bacteroidales bacterium]